LKGSRVNASGSGFRVRVQGLGLTLNPKKRSETRDPHVERVGADLQQQVQGLTQWFVVLYTRLFIIKLPPPYHGLTDAQA